MTDPTSALPTVSVGPFDERPDGELRDFLGLADRRQRQLAWLTLVLEQAGVELWHGDMSVAHDLATNCSPETIHVIGGWIARAAAQRADTDELRGDVDPTKVCPPCADRRGRPVPVGEPGVSYRCPSCGTAWRVDGVAASRG